MSIDTPGASRIAASAASAVPIAQDSEVTMRGLRPFSWVRSRSSTTPRIIVPILVRFSSTHRPPATTAATMTSASWS